MKVWMRGWRAASTAWMARSTSFGPVRARPQTIGALDLLGDRLHRLEIAVGRDRKARLDDVDAELLELARDRELLVEIHAAAGRLLAVAQRRVEDPDPVAARARSVAGLHRPPSPPRDPPTDQWSAIEVTFGVPCAPASRSSRGASPSNSSQIECPVSSPRWRPHDALARAVAFRRIRRQQLAPRPPAPEHAGRPRDARTRARRERS